MVFLSVGKKQLFYFFKRWLFAVGKNKCAVCALAFLVQMLMFRAIFRIMHNLLYGEQTPCL